MGNSLRCSKSYYLFYISCLFNNKISKHSSFLAGWSTVLLFPDRSLIFEQEISRSLDRSRLIDIMGSSSESTPFQCWIFIKSSVHSGITIKDVTELKNCIRDTVKKITEQIQERLFSGKHPIGSSFVQTSTKATY